MYVIIALAILGTLILSAWFVYQMAQLGSKKYGLRMYSNWTFFTSSLSLIIIIIGSFLLSDKSASVEVHENGLAALLFGLGFLCFSIWKNCKESNFLFGIGFTFAQFLSLLLVYLAFMLMQRSHRSSSHGDYRGN